MVGLARFELALRDVRSVFDYPVADSPTSGSGQGSQTLITGFEDQSPVQLNESAEKLSVGWALLQRLLVCQVTPFERLGHE